MVSIERKTSADSEYIAHIKALVFSICKPILKLHVAQYAKVLGIYAAVNFTIRHAFY